MSPQHFLHCVRLTFAQYHGRAFSRGLNVPEKIWQIDRPPYFLPRLPDFCRPQILEVMKIGGGPLEYGSLEYREPLDVPLLHIIFIRIEVDAEVKVVCGHGGAIPQRPLQDIEPFENQDLGPVYGLKLSWDDIVQLMRVDRPPEAPTSLLLAPQKDQHSFQVIAFLENPYDALGSAFQELRLATESRPSRPILPFGPPEPARRGEPWRRCSFQRLRYRPLQSRKDERHWPPFEYSGVGKEVQ